MGTRQFVYHNQDGVRRTMFYDTDDNTQVGVNTEVRIDEIIDGNKNLAELVKPFSTNKLVARVPLTIYEQSVREQWDEDRWKHWLNDPDNKLFRVWQGKV